MMSWIRKNRIILLVVLVLVLGIVFLLFFFFGNRQTAKVGGRLKGSEASDIPPQEKPVSIIIDTDIGNSTDDLFALEVAYQLMDLGYVNIEGVISSRPGEGYADLLDIFNTYYGYSNIPIGVERNGVTGSKEYIDYRALDEMTNSDGSRMFARTDEDLSDNLDGYKLYRKILAQAEDHSVKVIVVGFLSCLDQLMDSEPDEFSSLSGMELIRQKVDSLYFMGTKLGESDKLGYNLRYDIPLAKRFFQEWPEEVPVYLSPSPVGDSIEYTPEAVLEDLRYDDNNPIRRTYENYDCDTGQMMWDPLCVINAVFPEYFRYSSTGTISITDNETVVFTETADGPFRYQLAGDDVWADQQLVLIRYYTLMH